MDIIKITVIIFLIPITLIIILTILLMTWKGIEMCQKNDALGVFLLFCALNIFGLILGICLLYNFKNKLMTIKKLT